MAKNPYYKFIFSETSAMPRVVSFHCDDDHSTKEEKALLSYNKLRAESQLKLLGKLPANVAISKVQK